MSNEDSFKNCKKWVQEFNEEFKKENSLAKPIAVLVGTKGDLKEFSKISTQDIESFCGEHGLEHFETAAINMNDESIENPFNHIAQQFHTKYLERVKYFEELPL
jgi:GTPase SAR1 family protein